MNQFSSKICVLGDFAVGKTSTVERFVNNQFSDKYLTTIGVKVDTKEVSLHGADIKLIIWDVAGTDRFGEIEFAYLRGASGYILVADSTRYETVNSAQKLRRQVEERYGQLPFVFLLNKSDLIAECEVTDKHIESIRASCEDFFITSAKTGRDVEDAILRLTSLVAAREFNHGK